MSRTWLPRWSLVNFYARHGRRQEELWWSRLALERASDDVAALFPLLQETGASASTILDILPKNRSVISAWLAYQLQLRPPHPEAEQSALQLAALIPHSAPGWPGTSVSIWPQHIYPATEQESALLLATVDRLLDEAKAPQAARLWNLLTGAGIVSGSQWSSAAPVTNNRFRFDTSNAGLDWRLNANGDGVQTITESGELILHLDGHQPESVQLLKQRTYIPAGVAYQLAIESRTEDLADDGSLEWQILNQAGQSAARIVVHPSENWRHDTDNLAALAEDRVVNLVLTCRRPPGSVRAQGTVRFRLVSLEQVH